MNEWMNEWTFPYRAAQWRVAFVIEEWSRMVFRYFKTAREPDWAVTSSQPAPSFFPQPPPAAQWARRDWLSDQPRWPRPEPPRYSWSRRPQHCRVLKSSRTPTLKSCPSPPQRSTSCRVLCRELEPSRELSPASGCPGSSRPSDPASRASSWSRKAPGYPRSRGVLPCTDQPGLWCATPGPLRPPPATIWYWSTSPSQIQVVTY